MIGSHIRELYEIFLVHNARAEQDGNVITVTYMLKTYEYVSKYAFLDNGEVYYIGLVSYSINLSATGFLMYWAGPFFPNAVL